MILDSGGFKDIGVSLKEINSRFIQSPITYPKASDLS